MAGTTLDTGALIAIERGSARMQVLIDEAEAAGVELAVPAGALAQAWRGSPRRARLARFLRLACVSTVPLDDVAARAAGVLCGHTSTDDVVDASVVVCARSREQRVVTSDSGDLRRLDPTLELREI